MRQSETTTQCEGPCPCPHRGPQQSDGNERPHQRGQQPGNKDVHYNCGPHQRGLPRTAHFGPPPYFGQEDYSSDDDEHIRCGPHHRGPHRHGHERPHFGPHFGAPSHLGPFSRFGPTAHFGPSSHHMGPMMSPLHHGWPNHHRGPWGMPPHSCHRHHDHRDHRCGRQHQDNADRNSYYFLYVNRSTN